jgi:hypothetical protein
MADTTVMTTAPATPSIDLGAFLQSVVDSAKTSLFKIGISVGGMFSSVLGGGTILALAQKIDPAAVSYLTDAVGVAVMLMGAFASGYHLVTHVSATNSATAMLGEKTINNLQSTLGLPVTDWTAANNGQLIGGATS